MVMNGIDVGHPIFESRTLTAQQVVVAFFANIMDKEFPKGFKYVVHCHVAHLSCCLCYFDGGFVRVVIQLEKVAVFIAVGRKEIKRGLWR